MLDGQIFYPYWIRCNRNLLKYLIKIQDNSLTRNREKTDPKPYRIRIFLITHLHH